MKDKVEGTIKEQKGKLTDDLGEEIEGKAQKQYGEAKDTASDKLDDADEALTREHEDARHDD